MDKLWNKFQTSKRLELPCIAGGFVCVCVMLNLQVAKLQGEWRRESEVHDTEQVVFLSFF